MKQLDHRGPLALDISGAWYFITICAEERVDYGRVVSIGETAREDESSEWRVSPTSVVVGALTPKFNEILECARQYHVRGIWKLALFIVMPDHLHFIVHVPAPMAVGGTTALPHVVAHWKHYVSEHCGIRFQKDFWDTRLRDDAHYAEKFRYVCNNPVRKGLCATARAWKYVIAFDRETGEERAHR